MKIDEMNSKADLFLTKAFRVLDEKKIYLDSHWHIDHLCYRTNSESEYSEVKNHFSHFSELLIESEVGGRLISTFKLREPLIFREWRIDLIEVPAPKVGKNTPSGFEHFEVVCDVSFNEIKKRFSAERFSDKGAFKDFNQELEMSFDDFAIKFHHLSLESVINVESNDRVFKSLRELGILKTLKAFSPLVAGTFPLRLNTAKSDIDILIYVKDFNETKKILEQEFSSYPQFQYTEKIINEELSLVCSFYHQDICYEIFGQQKMSILQDGYRHFLIEERLLKLSDETFFKAIKKLKEEGLKTEPAFTKVLGLGEVDSYKELLNIQKISNKKLEEMLKK